MFAELGEGLGGLYGSIIGEIWASGDQKKADEAYKRGMAYINGLNIPADEKLKIQAELAQLVALGPSAMEDVKVDPALEQNQRQNMDQLQRIADANGMDQQAVSAQRQAQRMAGQQTASRLGSIKSGMAARGIRGSGLELLANMQAQQNEADTNANTGFQAAAAGSNRAMNARLSAAGLAGEMSDRSFGQQRARAEARDAVNRFNTDAANTTNRFNAGQRQNTNMFNSNVVGQQYERRRQLAEMKANGEYGLSDRYDGKANRKRGIATNAGRMVGGSVGTGMDMYSGGGF